MIEGPAIQSQLVGPEALASIEDASAPCPSVIGRRPRAIPVRRRGNILLKRNLSVARRFGRPPVPGSMTDGLSVLSI